MATEDQIAAVETNPNSTKTESADEKPKKPRKTKATKPKKPAGGTRKPRGRNPSTHPPYEEMIKDAIVGLKERTGSSQYAICKYIEGKQKNLPSVFKKLLLYNLKKLVSAGKLTKVKASYKLPPARSSVARPAVTKSAKANQKPKSPAKVKPKAKAKEVTPKKVSAKPKVAAKGAPVKKAKAIVVAKPKGEKKPAKVARTSMRSTPGRKTAAVAPKMAGTKKVASRGGKAKSVKSPVKKVGAKRGRK